MILHLLSRNNLKIAKLMNLAQMMHLSLYLGKAITLASLLVYVPV